MHSFIYLFIYPFIYLFTYLIYLFIYLLRSPIDTKKINRPACLKVIKKKYFQGAFEYRWILISYNNFIWSYLMVQMIHSILDKIFVDFFSV